MLKQFLNDNGFSDRAAGVGTYIKDMSKDIKAIGLLHAHIKVNWPVIKNGNSFKIHATIRTDSDTKLLAFSNDEEAVGRAIWVYSNNTYHSPQKLAHWVSEGKVTYQELKTYCRKLASKVNEWEVEIARENVELVESNHKNKALKIAMIGIIKPAKVLLE